MPVDAPLSFRQHAPRVGTGQTVLVQDALAAWKVP